MTIETDKEAIANAQDGDERRSESEFTQKDFDFQALTAATPLYHVFFVYMRIDSDGAFVAKRYFHQGAVGTPIDPDTGHPDQPDTLGWYARDMAYFARPHPLRAQGNYMLLGEGLDGFQFPQFRSYVVFFMDDLHWPYLEDDYGNPVVPFHSKKGKKTGYATHKHAFSPAKKFRISLINNAGISSDREAIFMINYMKNKNNTDLGDHERESFCFDLIMRVRYAGSTDGLTVIIDPTGDNLGPPPPGG